MQLEFDDYDEQVYPPFTGTEYLSLHETIENHPYSAAFGPHIPHPNCHKRVFTEYFLDNESKQILYLLV
jgi:hypothetical protein